MTAETCALVLWDFNGTLLDDAALCVSCLNETRRRRSMPEVSLDYYLEHFGFPVVDFYKKAGFTFERESFADVAREWNDLYHERVWTSARLHEGVVPVLEGLAASGVRQGILSAYHHGMVLVASGSGCRSTRSWTDDFHATAGDLVRWVESRLDWRIILIGDTLHDRDVALLRASAAPWSAVDIRRRQG